MFYFLVIQKVVKNGGGREAPASLVNTCTILAEWRARSFNVAAKRFGSPALSNSSFSQNTNTHFQIYLIGTGVQVDLSAALL